MYQGGLSVKPKRDCKSTISLAHDRRNVAMRLYISALCGTVAIALLSSCAPSALSTSPTALNSAGTTPESLVPISQRPSGPMALHGRAAFKAAPGGLYVSQFYSTSISAYPHLNSS